MDFSDGDMLQSAIDRAFAACGRVHCWSHFLPAHMCSAESSFTKLLAQYPGDMDKILLDRTALLCLATARRTLPESATNHGAFARGARCTVTTATADTRAIVALCNQAVELHAQLWQAHGKWADASDMIKDLQAAVEASREEIRLFKEVLQAIDPQTGRPLTEHDPGSVDRTREQWKRLFRKIAQAAEHTARRTVGNRDGLRDKCQQTEEAPAMPMCEECARLRRHVQLLADGAAAVYRRPKQRLNDCCNSMCDFMAELQTTLMDAVEQRARGEAATERAVEIEGECRRIMDAALQEKKALEQRVRSELLELHAKEVKGLQAEIARLQTERDEARRLAAQREHTIQTLKDQREADRVAMASTATSNARTQQGWLERISVLQRDLVGARQRVDMETLRANAAEAAATDARAAAAKARAELEELRSAHAHASAALASLQSEMGTRVAERDSLIARRDERIVQLQAALADLARQSEARDGSVADLAARIDELATEVKRKELDVATLETQLSRSRTACNTLAQRAEVAERDGEQKMSALGTAHARIAELEQALAALPKEPAEAWARPDSPLLPSALVDEHAMPAVAVDFADDHVSVRSGSSVSTEYEIIDSHGKPLEYPTALWRPKAPPAPAARARPPEKPMSPREERRAVIRRFLAARSSASAPPT
eukprot:m.245144 g.245144  ORF g.245144 m.245144 type:complete len:663 (-) comp14612_c0_seq1:376-2364(-)